MIRTRRIILILKIVAGLITQASDGPSIILIDWKKNRGLLAFVLRTLKTLYHLFVKLQKNKNWKDFCKEFFKKLWRKINAWNIRCWVNEMIVPLTQQPTVLYWRLSDFRYSWQFRQQQWGSKIEKNIYLLKYKGTPLFFSLQKNHQCCTLLFQVQKLIHLSNIRPWKTLLHHLMLKSHQIRGYIVKVLLALMVEIHNHILQEKYINWLLNFIKFIHFIIVLIPGYIRFLGTQTNTVRPWDARFWGPEKIRVAQTSCNLSY